MSAEQFFVCIGEIEDRFIEEAEHYHKSVNQAFPFRRSKAAANTTRGGGTKSRHLLHWIPVAACLALLVIGGARFIQLKGGISLSSGSDNGATGGQAADSSQQASSSALNAVPKETCDKETADEEAPMMSAPSAVLDSYTNQQNEAGEADGLEKSGETASAILQYPAKYIQTNGYAENREYPYTVVIRSEAELAEYVSTNANTFDFAHGGESSESFCEAVEVYNETYFESSALVFAVLENGSCSIEYQVEGITPENKILVERLLPEVYDDGMSEWHIILEVPSDSPVLESEQPLVVEELEALYQEVESMK